MTLLQRGVPMLLLALGGCIAVSDTGGEAAPEPGEVKFEMVGPGGAALVVPVRINDAGPFPFVLDTGATLTCVDDALAQELKLPEDSTKAAIGGTIGGSGSMRLVTLESVAIGEATVQDLSACVVDLAPMRAAGVDIRGLLGLNVLREYTLTVDFGRTTVRLDPPSAESPETASAPGS